MSRVKHGIGWRGVDGVGGRDGVGERGWSVKGWTGGGVGRGDGLCERMKWADGEGEVAGIGQSNLQGVVGALRERSQYGRVVGGGGVGGLDTDGGGGQVVDTDGKVDGIRGGELGGRVRG